MDHPGKVANPARGQLNRKNEYPLCPRTRLRIWSRQTASVIPSRVSLLILHTLAEPGAYSWDSFRFPRRRPFIYLNIHTPSGQSRVYRVTQLRTDGVHCRESADTRPVVLEVISVTGAAILQVTMDQLMCASLVPRPLLVRSGRVENIGRWNSGREPRNPPNDDREEEEGVLHTPSPEGRSIFLKG